MTEPRRDPAGDGRNGPAGLASPALPGDPAPARGRAETGRDLPDRRDRGDGGRVGCRGGCLETGPGRPVVTARITGLGAAVPAVVEQATLWRECFAARYAGTRLAEGVWAGTGIARRHAVVDPRFEDVSGWGTGARMERYLTEAMPLAKGAVLGALDAAGTPPNEVGLLAVASCTGYATPGVDILLARDLAMDTSVQRLLIGHMGCYAALPGLGVVGDAVAARGLTAVLLCVELPSLHIQPSADDLEQVVAHALFSDAAAAVVVAPGAPGLELVDIAARTAAEHHRDMTWEVTDLGFRMGLSVRVPVVLARHVADVVDGLLARHRLGRADVAGWAVHPGGPRILDVCADRLGLDAEAMAASRLTLTEHGNCSSATILLVLDELRRSQSLAAGDHVVALAFGPGLTLYAALLRQVG